MTALRPLPRDRVAVELDGEEWRTVPADAVARAGIRDGLELDRDRLRTFRRELRRSEALRRAGSALRARDHSTASLAARLERAGIAPAAREEAIRALTDAGIVDDGRLARACARALAERGVGDAAIEARLLELGLGAEVIQPALAEQEPEAERARRLVARRGATLATARYLARRGFSAEAVEEAVGAVLAQPERAGYDTDASSDIFPA